MDQMVQIHNRLSDKRRNTWTRDVFGDPPCAIEIELDTPHIRKREKDTHITEYTDPTVAIIQLLVKIENYSTVRINKAAIISAFINELSAKQKRDLRIQLEREEFDNS